MFLYIKSIYMFLFAYGGKRPPNYWKRPPNYWRETHRAWQNKSQAWQDLEVKSSEHLSWGEILYDFKEESQRTSPWHPETHTCVTSPLMNAFLYKTILWYLNYFIKMCSALTTVDFAQWVLVSICVSSEFQQIWKNVHKFITRIERNWT